MKRDLCVAGCQFAVEADVEHNLKFVLRQMRQAAERGARIVHFPEAALSGYAGVDIDSTDAIDWNALRQATETICSEAAKQHVWVLLGSAHPLSHGHKPHNCVYVISDAGRVVERYDKRFCTGTLAPEPRLDLQHYTPGDHTCVFELDGLKCGVLICYDYRFCELYRDLKRRGVEIVFQSFHNARRSREEHEASNIWADIVPATMMCRAASNHVWVSATNSATRYSSWPSFFVRPDGRITGRLDDHEPGVLLSDVDLSLDLWDAPGPWRERAMDGVLYSGEPVSDSRSADRTCY